MDMNTFRPCFVRFKKILSRYAVKYGLGRLIPPPLFFSKLSKRDISANVFEHFEIPTVGKNIYSGGTATDREREEDVWGEIAKGVWREISK
jgi:hypothetical protein